MEARGIIRRSSQVEARTGAIGHRNLTGYRFLQPGDAETSYVSVALDDIQPGGGIDPHYHTDVATFDHVYYVISGEIAVRLGDQEEQIVEDDTAIYCPSNVVHSIKNVGTSNAKVLRIGASATGDVKGKPVFL
ncbi:MAG: cupin domain-containing protein [Chloroflexi bacterium]|nr:cupin domain-containing protein [Chloroflexota bacterium]